MSWEKSETFKEFIKIASENENFIDLSKEVAKNPYSEESQEIHDKGFKKSDYSEDSIIEKAHPEPIYTAEALGDGGLVENQIEQHNKMVNIVNKMPTGSPIHYYACVIDELVKIANECDSDGETEAANLITKVAEDILGLFQNIPFVEAPVK